MFFFGKKKKNPAPAYVPQPAAPVHTPEIERWLRTTRKMDRISEWDLESEIYRYEPFGRNMINYPGTPHQYFRELLQERFPDYELEENLSIYPTSPVVSFLLSKGGRHRLAIVLVSVHHAGIYKLERYFEQEGVPVIRFYIDHFNWCNDAAYVCHRISQYL